MVPAGGARRPPTTSRHTLPSSPPRGFDGDGVWVGVGRPVVGLHDQRPRALGRHEARRRGGGAGGRGGRARRRIQRFWGGPSAKVLFGQGPHAVGAGVADDGNGQRAGPVVRLEERHQLPPPHRLHIGRIPNDRAPVVVREGRPCKGLLELAERRAVNARPPLLGDHRLFSVQLAKHRLPKAGGFKGEPQLQLVGRQGAVVARRVVRCGRVEPHAARPGQGRPKRVGHGQGVSLGGRGGQVGFGRRQGAGGRAGCLQVAQIIERGVRRVQQAGFGGGVGRANGRRAFKGHVFEQVGQACLAVGLVKCAHVGMGHKRHDRGVALPNAGADRGRVGWGQRAGERVRRAGGWA